MKRFLLFFLGMLMISLSGFSHALWIETSVTGKKGVSHEVKIFYGEYSEMSPEKVADWYSDVKDFTIWLVVPGKEKTKLTVTPSEDRYTCSFTPETDGVYSIYISHDAQKLGGKTKYQFNASAAVHVGATKEGGVLVDGPPLKFSYDKNSVNKPITVNAKFNDSPADKFQTTVVSPKGWTLQIAGKDGAAKFTPEWKGKYMIEIAKTTPEKGDHNGAAYESVWRCNTRLVEVN